MGTTSLLPDKEVEIDGVGGWKGFLEGKVEVVEERWEVSSEREWCSLSMSMQALEYSLNSSEK